MEKEPVSRKVISDDLFRIFSPIDPCFLQDDGEGILGYNKMDFLRLEQLTKNSNAEDRAACTGNSQNISFHTSIIAEIFDTTASRRGQLQDKCS
jgi:hypothetical protein